MSARSVSFVGGRLLELRGVPIGEVRGLLHLHGELLRQERGTGWKTLGMGPCKGGSCWVGFIPDEDWPEVEKYLETLPLPDVAQLRAGDRSDG